MVLAVGIFAVGAPFSIFLAQVGIFLALALCLADGRRALRPLQRFPWVAGALGFYFLVQATSILYSQHPLRSLICLRGDWPVLFLPIFLAALQLPAARRWGRDLLLLSGSLAGAVGLWQHLKGTDPLRQAVLEADGTGRFYAVGSLSGHLTYGGVMMLLLVAAFTLLVAGERRRRALPLLATILTAAGLGASYARSAWVGGAAGIAAGLLVVALAGRSGAARPLPLRWRLVPGLAIVAAAAIFLLVTPGFRDRLVAAAVDGEARLRLWETALRIFAAFPVFGAGLGSFKTHFELFKVPGSYMATGHPHNDLLNVLVHSGLAGALAWLGLWAGILVTAGRVRDRALAPRALLVALVACLLAAGMLQCYFTDEEPSGVFWFLVALALSTLGADRPRPPALDQRHPTGARRLEQRIKRLLLPTAGLLFLNRPARRIPAPLSGQLAAARRILLIRQDNRLGNLVLITPFLQALRGLAPRARIALLVGERFADLLDRAPWIDELIVMRKRWLIRHPWAYPGHVAAMRAVDWDLAFDLSNPDTHSFYHALVPILVDAPLRVGFDHPRSRAALNAPVAPPADECHYSLAPLLLLSALGAAPQVLPPQIPPALIGSVPSGTRRSILFHPGARGGKQWSPAKSIQLLERLKTEVGDDLTVIGGPGEAAQLDDLARRIPRLEVRLIRTLADLIGVLQCGRLYIGCDAGPLHVAAALACPTIALFIDSHPLRYAPLGEVHETILLGEGSREWARRAKFHHGDLYSRAVTDDRRDPPLHWDREFGARLAAWRPRITAAPKGLAPDAEVSWVHGRIRQAVARTAPQSVRQRAEDGES